MDRYIKFDIRKVAYIPLFFLFLPAFCVLVGNKAIPIFFIVNVIFFIILITFFYKKLFKHLIFLYKNTPFKYFTYWSLWIMLSGIILIILGKYTISRYLYYMILYLLINMVLPLLLPTIIFYKKSIVQNFIKIFFIALTIIFILGIINFIATLFSINILNKIFSFIVNQRELRGVYYSVGIRAQSVFAEPGWFAGFICFNLPIIYSTINSKYKIFNNTIINLAIKKIMIPLVWINIILTKSPIWLIFCLLITILYNIKNIKNFLLKYFHKILILIVFISILVSHLSVNNTYLNRIQNTVQPLSKLDYNTFSIVEPSLASRITSYYNSLRLFLDYPITGIGLGNGKFYMSEKFNTSKLELTIENHIRLELSYKTGKLGYNNATVYQLLSETGIIGFLLYYIFLYLLYCKVNYYTHIYNGLLKDYLTGLSKSILSLFFIFSIYDVDLGNTYIWFMLGFALSIKRIMLTDIVEGKKC